MIAADGNTLRSLGDEIRRRFCATRSRATREGRGGGGGEEGEGRRHLAIRINRIDSMNGLCACENHEYF